jgi:hypothetical protein
MLHVSWDACDVWYIIGALSGQRFTAIADLGARRQVKEKSWRKSQQDRISDGIPDIDSLSRSDLKNEKQSSMHGHRSIQLKGCGCSGCTG